MRRVVIAGGTGLIGWAFARRLVETGHEVVILTRRSVTGVAIPGVLMVQWDGRNRGPWENYLEGAEALVNLAGENIGSGKWTGSFKQKIVTSRLEAGRVLSQACAACKQKPDVFIQASAIGYYGVTGERSAVEISSPGHDFLSKVAVQWEESSRVVEDLGIRRVILRTGIVLSAQGGALPRLVLPFRLFAGGPLGDGSQYWSWIHLQDEVRIMQYLMEIPSAQGVYNLTAPVPARMNELGKALAEVLKRPFWLPAPAFALRLLLGEQGALLLDSQRVIPERLLKSGYVFDFSDIRLALADILR